MCWCSIKTWQLHSHFLSCIKWLQRETRANDFKPKRCDCACKSISTLICFTVCINKANDWMQEMCSMSHSFIANLSGVVKRKRSSHISLSNPSHAGCNCCFNKQVHREWAKVTQNCTECNKALRSSITMRLQTDSFSCSENFELPNSFVASPTSRHLFGCKWMHSALWRFMMFRKAVQPRRIRLWLLIQLRCAFAFK